AVALPGCASSAPPRPAARPFDHVRQLAIVVSGESRFSVLEHRAEPGRTFDEVLKWGVLSPYQALLRPVAELVHKGVNWLLDGDRRRHLGGDRGRDRSRAAADEVLHRRPRLHAPAADRRAAAGRPEACQRATVRAGRRPVSAWRSLWLVVLLAAAGCASTAGLDV